MTEEKGAKLPGALGFREGLSSVHSSRTMMFRELSLTFENVPKTAGKDNYVTAIVEQNILGKPTQATRKRTAERLVELYGLDQSRPVFRLLRHFWTTGSAGCPLLACIAAAARDPLLRSMMPMLLATPIGAPVAPAEIVGHLKERYPSRFRPTTLLSTSQNLASSWTQAGYLTGKMNKKRTRPVATPVVVTFALLLGYLCGHRGKMLLDTDWCRMLDRTTAEVAELAVEASGHGWMNYRAAGTIFEITFPGLLTPQEEKLSRESN